MKWFKVTPIRLTDGKPLSSQFVYAESDRDAAIRGNCWMLPHCEPDPHVVEIDPSEVHYKRRAFTESTPHELWEALKSRGYAPTTEELRDMLKKRGYKVVLS